MNDLNDLSEGPINDLLVKIDKGLQELGIYSDFVRMNCVVPQDEEETAPSSQEELLAGIKSGDGVYTIVVRARVGKLAWTDRVLNPEKFSDDVLFSGIMPSKLELLQSYVTGQLEAGVAFEDIDMTPFGDAFDDVDPEAQ